MCKKLFKNRLFLMQGILFILLILRDVNVLILPGITYLGLAVIIPVFLGKEDVIAYSVGFAMMGTGIQVAYITLACFCCYTYKNKFRVHTKQLIFVLIMLVYESVHILFSNNDSLVEFIRYAITYVYVFFVLFEDYDTNTILKISKSYINATVFVCIDVLLQMLTMLDITIVDYLNMSLRLGYSDQLQQVIRFSADPNLLAQSCTISLVIAVLLFKNKYSDVFLKTAMILLLLFGLMTLSKTFLLSLIFIVLCLMLKTSVETNVLKSIKNIFIAVFFVLIAIIIIYNVYPSYFENINARFDTNDLTTGRVRIAQNYFTYLIKEPFAMFFGVGLQNLGVKTGCGASPHAAIVECLTSFGLIGTIFIIWLIVKAIYKITKKQRKVLLVYMPFFVTLVLIQSTQFFRMRDRILTLIVVVVLCGINHKSEGVLEVHENEKKGVTGY